MLSHFPSRKFEQVSFDDLLKALEPAHLKKTPSFSYMLPRVRKAFGEKKAREVTTEKVQEFLDRLKDDEGLSGSSVNNDPELDLQRGCAARAVRREPGAGDPPVPRAARARPVPERR